MVKYYYKKNNRLNNVIVQNRFNNIKRKLKKIFTSKTIYSIQRKILM